MNPISSITPNSAIKRVLFLAFPNVGEQDLLAPWEVFRSLAWAMSHQGERLDVTLGSFEGGTITTHMGAQLGTEKINPTDRFDLVYVPGGIGAGAASLNDTIVDANHSALLDGVATGFQFAPVTVEALEAALARAAALYRDRPAWRRMQRRGMTRRVGWARAAEQYAELYRAALANRAPG